MRLLRLKSKSDVALSSVRPSTTTDFDCRCCCCYVKRDGVMTLTDLYRFPSSFEMASITELNGARGVSFRSESERSQNGCGGAHGITVRDNNLSSAFSSSRAHTHSS